MIAVEFKNITKNFGSFTALEKVTFGIQKNSVHCVLGENGAGKSTLMKILFGMYKADSGDIFVSANPVKFNSPHDAIDTKIGMVHQHFMLIDDFTVLENVILGNEQTAGLKINFREIKSILIEIIDKYNLKLNPDSKVSDLNISAQQKVEILKLLYRDSEILIFDEPTAVLSPVEVIDFFKIIKEFKKNNKTIILVTHKLNEVKVIADRVTVLRKGKVVYEENNCDNNLDVAKLAQAIVGENMINVTVNNAKENISGEESVSLKNITFIRNNIKILDELNLSLKEGDIFGICGVEGNGQNEIAEIISGLEKNYEGEFLNYKDKVSFVPDDRINKGMIKEFSVGENFYLKNGKNSFVTQNILDKYSEAVIKEYDVRLKDNKAVLASLSGGNQQKVIVAREVSAGNDVLIFSHPTRGVDLNASAFIHSKILEERNKNKSILLISSDLDELTSLSDRLCVLFKGKIVKTYEKDDLKDFSEIDCESELNTDRKNKLFEELGKLMIGI